MPSPPWEQGPAATAAHAIGSSDGVGAIFALLWRLGLTPRCLQGAAWERGEKSDTCFWLIPLIAASI